MEMEPEDNQIEENYENVAEKNNEFQDEDVYGDIDDFDLGTEIDKVKVN